MRLAVIGVAVTVATYGAFAFILAEANAMFWTPEHRCCLVIALVVTAVSAAVEQAKPREDR